ncbi:MAG TPA: toll/interleukin-1 receptor domain-containing protein [Pyrinomonadaceae bacterium]|nr:toll/interleukin-1 receptor domain-containing protein [Pyrinomonadaceae bacterium]
MSSKNDYRYDVFISYRWVPPDMSWVRDELKPALENAGLEVLLDVEDFVPGRDVILEMTRGTRESRHGLCVLSPDYVNDPDRMVNFESLMLRGKDPSGNSSRLVPFIIRPTEVPEYIRNLVAIDWTDATHHAREWTKLLDLLKAKDRNAPPPGPLQVDPNAPRLPKPPVRSQSNRIPKPVWLTAVVALLIGLFAVGYIKYRGSKLRPPIEGHVYYKQADGETAQLPVEGVTVSLSTMSSVQSEQTGPDGKFVLNGIPVSAPLDLKAEYGQVSYPMGYQSSGNYLVIPRDANPNRKLINASWSDTPNEDCLPDDERNVANFKVYKSDIEFQIESGKSEALLTIELADAPEVTIRSADVSLTPADSFRNLTRPGEDRAKSHTWSFNLSKSGPATHLVVCLGSDNSVAEISSGKLLTYYSLQ